MPMKPGKDESQSEFMSRCVPDMKGDGRRPTEQAVAACLEMWRSEKGGKKPPSKSDEAEVKRVIKAWCTLLKKQATPDPDESHGDFISRCVDEMMAGGDVDEVDAEDACELAWEERSVKTSAVVQKTHAAEVNGMEFILSDDSPDRLGDIVLSSGWQIEAFKKNPIALFSHDPKFIVGKWHNLRIENNALRGKLELAPAGTSARIDEIRKLVEAGILKAVSVGFRPLASRPRQKSGLTDMGALANAGLVYEKSELVETSLVAIPANANALAVAKSLRISGTVQRMVFAEQGEQKPVVAKRRPTAEQGAIPPSRKAEAMSLAQRIQDEETALVKLRDGLTEHLKQQDDNNVSDADIEMTTDFNAKIAQKEKNLGALREAETRLAASSIPHQNGGVVVHNGGGDSRVIVNNPRPFAIPAKKVLPQDYVWRSLCVAIKHHAERGKRPILEVLKDTYGEDEGTKAVLDIVCRAASVPATTTATGWAIELVTTAFGDFLEALTPVSIFPKLAAKGTSFSFGRNGIISLPMRSATPTIAGSFVGEGAPIPVRQAAFASVQLTPKKMGVISTFTREISEHSTPAIEGIIRETIVNDTAVAVDSVLMDNNAATAIRPAGLRNGVSTLTPTAGGGFAGVVGDVRLLVGTLITNTLGNLRSPVFLMSPGDALAISLIPNTAGDLPFRDEVGRGTLMGIPIIQSTSVTPDTVFLIDAADFSSVTDTEPRFDVSDQAVLHMEDTTPLQLSTVGTPATVAAPARSLWQTDTIGIRMLMNMNWTMRRTGMVQYITGVTWN